MAIQRIASKWEKTNVIKQKEFLRDYVPETRKYTFGNLKDMMEAHGMLFVKPDHGTYGNGVMSVEYWSDELVLDGPIKYKLRYGIEFELYNTVEELHKALEEKMGVKPYLIQKGIHSLTYQRRKFDIRALVQKSPYKTWETTGLIGRVAALQKVITNYHGGGTVMPIEDLLGPYFPPKEFAKLYKEIKFIGISVAAQLAYKYPNLKEIGLDIAVDEQHQIWILEVNTLPALFPFKMLENKNIYKRIRRYAIAYGRLKSTSGK